jgi:ATP/maltotriose-dependent transcriptional regulator MalT
MQAETLLVRDVVRSLDAEQRAALRRIAAGVPASRSGGVGALLRDELLARFPNMLRLDAREGTLRFNAPELAPLFMAALEESAEPGDEGDPPQRILNALASGDPAAALELFRQAGGTFFIHFHGAETCLRVLNAFPRAMQQNEQTLVLSGAMHALKAGSTSRARYLVSQRFGADALDLALALSQPQRFPVELRLFRFVMAMYEDLPITDAMRVRLFDALGEVPLDSHLQRGSFYNAMLEIHVRRRELDAAAELARRARHHYSATGAHLLGFYVDVYQAVLSLMRGAPAKAETFVWEAREALGRVPFETESDARILGLVHAVIRYEQGDMQPIVRFLGDDFDKFAYGEMWPTLAEMTINYGGSALARNVSLQAARTFLDRWHVQEWRSNRFRLAITLREAALLQAANRWQEATDLLTPLQSRVNRTWVEGAVDSLIRLSDPGEIGIALAWLRHLIWEVPRRHLLSDQLSELLRNDHLSDRQRITVLVWSAHVARAQRDVSAARAALLKAFEASARLGTVMPLVEEGAMARRLMEDGRISRFVLTSADARDVLRRMKAFDAPVPEGARNAGLTRQEMRVLGLVVEGGTNKSVARRLGLSEVTVKFHLSNVYRKIGCRRRSEAIAAAKALGWVG